MKIKDITDVLELVAPLELQSEYDNAGLIVGDALGEVDSLLACVDVTEDTIEEAIEHNIKLIVAHHPLIFKPLKTLGETTYIERTIRKAIKNDIAIYACHTNLDRTRMSFALAAKLGLTGVYPLPCGDGFGAVGKLKDSVKTPDYLKEVMRILGLGVLKHSEIRYDMVNVVALCTGSGRDMIAAAKEAGAQLYLSAEFRHNDYLDADQTITIADIGHWESEFCACEIIEGVIRKNFPTFAVRISERDKNPIKYLINV